MSSLSSSSVGSSSSLGNTSLRGFGGMVSGIDRDAIIEQMTLGTNTKITNQEKEITKLEWKQEIYRGISDQILDLYDNYSSYTSSSNLKDPSFFAKNIISTHGKDESTRFVTASGSSELVNNVAIQSVERLATASMRQSANRTGGKLQTSMTGLSNMTSSNLSGKQFIFANYNSETGVSNKVVWTLPSSYTPDGTTEKKEINYLPKNEEEYKTLVADLNAAFKEWAKGKTDIKEGSLNFNYVDGKIQLSGNEDFGTGRHLMAHSSALNALGYTGDTDVKDISFKDFNNNVTGKFSDAAVNRVDAVEYLTGRKLTFNYDGSKKEIELITGDEKNAFNEITVTKTEIENIINDPDKKSKLENTIKYELKSEIAANFMSEAITEALEAEKNGQLNEKTVNELIVKLYNDKLAHIDEKVEEQYSTYTEEMIEDKAKEELLATKKLDMLKENLQKRLDRAFGTGNIKVDTENGLAFSTKKDDSSIAITSNDYTFLNNLGIANGESSKLNLSGKLNQSALGIDINSDIYKEGLVINGVKIDGITADTSISSILSKINSSEAGVKATYISSEGQFMLISEETGEGREITLDSALAEQLFGSEINFNGTLGQDTLNVSNEKDIEFKINGKSITNIYSTDSITDILSKVNKQFAEAEDDSTKNQELIFSKGQFKLISTQTHKDITLDTDTTSDIVKNLLNFKVDENKGFEDGKDAIIHISYGNGTPKTITRASNTFDLEGMTVTVSGVFGGEYKTNDKGEKIWEYDTSSAVTFSAKADVDKAVEKVKTFFEDFNKLITEINTQVTSRPDSSYGPLTDEQKDEMDEKSIENWEKKAKTGLLYNDSTMRQLSMDVQSILTNFLNTNGFNYQDLEKMGITYSDNYKDGGTLVFDEAKFRSTMESDPESVSNVFVGGNKVKKGLMQVVEDTFTPYATRFASRNGSGKGSYGRLIEEAGSEKIPTSLLKNQIYNEIKSKQELIEQLRDKLKKEQDRYISQFSTMETLISQMNSQSSWLSQITG